MLADVLASEDGAGETAGAASGGTQDKARLRNKIIIHTPEERDRFPAYDVALRLHAKTTFSDIPFSDERWNRGTCLVLNNPKCKAGLIAGLNGTLIGCTSASVGECFIGEG